MSPAQCRAARALLNWTQDELATRSQASVVTIRNFENEKSAPQRGTMVLLEQAFDRAGVEFIPENGKGAGVRLKSRAIRLAHRKDVPHRKWIAAAVDYRGRREVVFVHYGALAQVALGNLAPEVVFDRDVLSILETARNVIDSEKRDAEGNFHIERGDL